jgi:MFS transporter, ACS family, tartrate transporter
LRLPQILQAMGFSNTATGFVVALCFLAGIPAMILVGRSSSRRGECIWHVAIPWLLAGASLAAASLVQSNAIILAARMRSYSPRSRLGWLRNLLLLGPFSVCPHRFCAVRAAAGGIGLINTFGSFGGVLGPVLIGALMQGSGDYASSFVVIALGYAMSALIVIAVGRAMAPRPVLAAAQVGGAE